MRFGILIDYHAPRTDRGVPTLWDGWYRDRAHAEEALRHFAAQSPGASAYLVETVE